MFQQPLACARRADVLDQVVMLPIWNPRDPLQNPTAFFLVDSFEVVKKEATVHKAHCVSTHPAAPDYT